MRVVEALDRSTSLAATVAFFPHNWNLTAPLHSEAAARSKKISLQGCPCAYAPQIEKLVVMQQDLTDPRIW